MPKELPVERFRIWVDDVDPPDVGPTVAALTKLGRGRVGFELIEDVRTFAKRTNHEVGSEAFLLEWIKDHPTFRAIEACKHFEANGRTKGSAYPALGVLVEKKILKKLDPGNYARADIKHIAPPTKNKPAKKRRMAKGPPKTFDKRGEDVILSFARRNHGRFNTAKLCEVFEEDGRAKNSVYASIDALLKNKMAKRVGGSGSGQYVLLNKGQTDRVKTKKKAPPKANGGTTPTPAEIAQEVTHG